MPLKEHILVMTASDAHAANPYRKLRIIRVLLRR